MPRPLFARDPPQVNMEPVVIWEHDGIEKVQEGAWAAHTTDASRAPIMPITVEAPWHRSESTGKQFGHTICKI